MVNKARFDQVFSGLTEIAKKVYHAVPDHKYCTPSWVTTELYAQGVRADKHIVQGCLNSLKKNGLLDEDQDGLFARAKVKPDIKKEIQPKEVKPVPEKTPNNPVDKLLAISLRLADLSDLAKSIATDIDSVVEDVERHMREGGEGAKKLNALRDLLKTI